MRRGGSKDDPKPHKLILLLAVLDLFDCGEIVENRVSLNAALIARFEVNFREFAAVKDWCQIGPPFFHLRATSFWRHCVRQGRETAYAEMRTVGGGLEQLEANVEYAYLDGPIFSMLMDRECRNKMREGLVEMLGAEADTEESAQRLGLAFHESFALSLPAVAQVLAVVAEGDGRGGLHGVSRGLLSEHTRLGPNYVRAMPRYCFGAGLLDNRYRLTRLGDAVCRHDKSLASPCSLWAMHYHLAAPQGPGPDFWHFVVTTLMRPGDILETGAVGVAVLGQAEQSGRSVKERTARSTASAMLGTYSKTDALGPLGVLAQDGGGRYRVLSPSPPPLWAFAYALADYWSANWGDVTGVNLARVAEPGGVGPIFLMGGGLINRYLGDLQREGFVIVQRRTPPFQLTRNWQSPEVFLERMYG